MSSVDLSMGEGESVKVSAVRFRMKRRGEEASLSSIRRRGVDSGVVDGWFHVKQR